MVLLFLVEVLSVRRQSMNKTEVVRLRRSVLGSMVFPGRGRGGARQLEACRVARRLTSCLVSMDFLKRLDMS